MPAAVWKGHLTFGLISIPIRLVRAARAERVNLRELARAQGAPLPRKPASVIELPVQEEEEEESRGTQAPHPALRAANVETVTPVRHAAVTGGSGQPVPNAEIVKGYEYQPEQWVLLDREEIRQIAPKTSQEMQITEFVRLGDIDPIYFEASYFAVPERTGEKAYAILFAALRDSGFAALAEVAMHRREHVVVIRPSEHGLAAHTMFFVDEVRRDLEYHADPRLVSARELQLARTLVESMASPFEPGKYRDKYREKLEALIAAKLQGRQTAVEAPAGKPAAPVIDILDALEKSLELARKPPAHAKREPAARKKAQRHTR